MAAKTLLAATVCLAAAACVHAIDNGLGRTPPMGWRSWNAYHADISQAKMTTAANAMVDKSRGVSLLEAGFENCGLDDYYQACGTGANGSFHNASGYPMIDHTKFPSMKAMTDHAYVAPPLLYPLAPLYHLTPSPFHLLFRRLAGAGTCTRTLRLIMRCTIQ